MAEPESFKPYLVDSSAPSRPAKTARSGTR